MEFPEGFMTPRGFEQWNPAFRGTYVKGWRAFMAGVPVTDWPYSDARTHRGAITWARAFITTWVQGWRDASSHNK